MMFSSFCSYFPKYLTLVATFVTFVYTSISEYCSLLVLQNFTIARRIIHLFSVEELQEADRRSEQLSRATG